MFTVKIEYETHTEVFPAAKYLLHKRDTHRILDLYMPRTETAYILSGEVVQEVDLDRGGLVAVYVMNGLGKTVDRYEGLSSR